MTQRLYWTSAHSVCASSQRPADGSDKKTTAVAYCVLDSVVASASVVRFGLKLIPSLKHRSHHVQFANSDANSPSVLK